MHHYRISFLYPTIEKNVELILHVLSMWIASKMFDFFPNLDYTLNTLEVRETA